MLLAACLAAQQQPIEFPHDKHVAINLQCIDCHTGVDSREQAGIPSVRKCMLCHGTFAKAGAAAEQLRKYVDKGREVPWVRVYGFPRESHVKFQHAPHTRAGVECKTCHGEVEKMTVAQPAVKHTMGTCLSCHRQQNATEDCVACHF